MTRCFSKYLGTIMALYVTWCASHPLCALAPILDCRTLIIVRSDKE